MIKSGDGDKNQSKKRNIDDNSITSVYSSLVSMALRKKTIEGVNTSSSGDVDQPMPCHLSMYIMFTEEPDVDDENGDLAASLPPQAITGDIFKTVSAELQSKMNLESNTNKVYEKMQNTLTLIEMITGDDNDDSSSSQTRTKTQTAVSMITRTNHQYIREPSACGELGIAILIVSLDFSAIFAYYVFSIFVYPIYAFNAGPQFLCDFFS